MRTISIAPIEATLLLHEEQRATGIAIEERLSLAKIEREVAPRAACALLPIGSADARRTR